MGNPPILSLYNFIKGCGKEFRDCSVCSGLCLASSVAAAGALASGGQL
jgi:hypothetical protein